MVVNGHFKHRIFSSISHQMQKNVLIYFPTNDLLCTYGCVSKALCNLVDDICKKQYSDELVWTFGPLDPQIVFVSKYFAHQIRALRFEMNYFGNLNERLKMIRNVSRRCNEVVTLTIGINATFYTEVFCHVKQLRYSIKHALKYCKKLRNIYFVFDLLEEDELMKSRLESAKMVKGLFSTTDSLEKVTYQNKGGWTLEFYNSASKYDLKTTLDQWVLRYFI